MQKHAIALLSALALLTSVGFADQSKEAADCSSCEKCCTVACDASTATPTADNKQTEPTAKKTSASESKAKADADC